MKTHKIGIIMNGVTGRMGTNQHLIRSIKAIIDQGGVKLSDSEIIMPDPVLVGRSEEKLKALAARVGVTRVSTNLDAELAKPDNQIYFDSTLTGQRPTGVRKAIAAKKHIYCEKPSATTASEALALAHEVTAAGLKNGVVQDKLWLPGLLKLKYLIDTGFSQASTRNSNARLGTTAKKTTAALSSICSATGSMSSKTSSAKLSP